MNDDHIQNAPPGSNYLSPLEFVADYRPDYWEGEPIELKSPADKIASDEFFDFASDLDNEIYNEVMDMKDGTYGNILVN